MRKVVLPPNKLWVVLIATFKGEIYEYICKWMVWALVTRRASVTCDDQVPYCTSMIRRSLTVPGRMNADPG